MFTRLVECNIKAGKVNEFTETLNREIIPLLRQQAGFVDEILLQSESKPQSFVSLSFWRTPEDAQVYHRQTYPQVESKLKPLLSREPDIRTFLVDTSTTHRIAAGKAA